MAITVAITRPDPGPLAEALEAEGVTVLHVPLIDVAPPLDGGAALRGALSRLESFDWLVVTSANGARAVGAAAASVRSVRLAAVGDTTARHFAALAGRPVDLVPREQRAAGLVAAFPPAPGRVLIAQADRAGAVVADGLRDKGAEVEVVTAYRTVLRVPPPGQLERLRHADVVLLASGSAAEALRAATQLPPSVRLVAIGPSTAAAARGLGLSVSVAASPATTDVVAAILGRP